MGWEGQGPAGTSSPVLPTSAWGILAGLIRSYFHYFPCLGSLTIVNVRVD